MLYNTITTVPNVFFLKKPCKFQKYSLYLHREWYKQNKMKSSQEYIDLIRGHLSELRERFGITSVRLFGSVARGEHHEGSDIDLFVVMPPKFYNYIEATQYLEEILGCKVDLISDHSHLRPFFKQQIERDGIDIHTAA